jgi:serine/threonine-protein kinase
LTQPWTGPSALVGRVLAGRYLLREIVAAGGMATVFRATRVVAEDEVAVKVMHPHLTRDRGFAQRFRREAKIAWQLDHPSIVRVIDHGVEGPLYFLVMELLDGEDLGSVLERHKRLPEAVARRIVVDVCEALVEAHGQGIVHRDLKPENVFLTRTADGDEVVVKVLDFGVAKLMWPEERTVDSDPVFTALGALLGTPEYLSPEMCRGEAVGPPADLYACGVLLYALLTGQPPFVTAKPLEVTMKHVSEEPVPPRRHLPDIDPRLDAIILQALAKRPEHRQASAAVLAGALDALGPAPPLPTSLLATSPRPRHSSEAPTLALPPDSGPVSRPPTADAAPEPDSAPASEPLQKEADPPASVQPSRVSPIAGPTSARKRAVWRVKATHLAILSVVVIVVTFLAGVAVGRWSVQAAPAGTGALR